MYSVYSLPRQCSEHQILVNDEIDRWEEFLLIVNAAPHVDLPASIPVGTLCLLYSPTFCWHPPIF